jgi:PTH1 family peptidyl-tRNA hydrolase
MQADFVLSKWLNNEVPVVQHKIQKCIEVIEGFAAVGIEPTMNEVNKLSIQA